MQTDLKQFRSLCEPKNNTTVNQLTGLGKINEYLLTDSKLANRVSMIEVSWSEISSEMYR